MSFYGNIFTNMGYTIEIIEIEGEDNFCLKNDSGAIVARIPVTELVPTGSITLDKINYKVEDGFLIIQ